LKTFDHKQYLRIVQYAQREVQLSRFRGDSELEAYASGQRLWKSLGMTGNFDAVRKLFPLNAT